MEFDQNLQKYLIGQATRALGCEKPDAQLLVDSAQVIYANGLGDQGIHLPQQKAQIAMLIEKMGKARAGETLRLVSPVCPDYSHSIDPFEGRVVYDFESLNDGIGLSASSVLEKAAKVAEALRKVGVTDIEYLILYADIEADDPNILGAMKMTREQFLTQVTRSCQNAQLAAAGLPARATVATISAVLEDCDYQRAQRLVDDVQPATLRSLGGARSDLYNRWFRDRFDDLTLTEINQERDILARNDILKSITFGSAIRRRGLIALDSTAAEFTAFYNYGDGLPPAPIIRVVGN